MHWRLYIEEYSPDLQYIKGTQNVVADALSWLDMNETPLEDTQESFLGLLECFGTKKTEELYNSTHSISNIYTKYRNPIKP
jgi:hypothetical protein